MEENSPKISIMKDHTVENRKTITNHKRENGIRKLPHNKSMKTGTACILCGYNRKNVSYHRFPTDSTRSEWLRLCELPEAINTRNLRVCGRHFAANKKFIRNDGSITLKKAVIPSLNLEVYGLNDEDDEDSIQPVSFMCKLQSAIEELSSKSNPSKHPIRTVSLVPGLPITIERQSSENVNRELPELNLVKLRNSVQQALQSPSEALNSESGSNSDLPNSLGIELVEVVEMKIYRLKNPEPASEATQSSEVNAVEPEVNPPDDDSTHTRGLEMHSYSKPASQERRHCDSRNRLRSVRYFGDLSEDNYATPQKAQNSWTFARRVIEKKNEKILHLEAENEVLERRLNNFREVLIHLRTDGSIPSKYLKRSQTSVPEPVTDPLLD